MGIRGAWIAGAILGLCSVARADDVSVRVEKWLSAGIEPAGVHDQLIALGRPAEDALWALYQDATKSRTVRLRALSELAWFATPRSAEGFAHLIRAAPTTRDPLSSSPLALRRALDGLSAIAEKMTTGVEARDLTHMLGHPDAHVRKAAAKLLALVDHGDVDGALNAVVANDPSRMVRATAMRAQTTRASRLAARGDR